MDPRTVLELRCVLRLQGGELLLDAELLEKAGDGEEPLNSTLLACNTSAMSAEPVNAEDRSAMTDALQWMSGEADGHPHDPARLPDDDVATHWGSLLARSLQQAIGFQQLDDLLSARARASDTHVRLVFRAADGAAARLPVETLVWPPGGSALVASHERSVSIVRTADTTDLRVPGTLALGARRPGRAYRHAAVIAAGLGQDYVNPSDVAAAVNALGQELKVPAGSFDEQMVAAASDADALLICGHGDGPRGVDIGSGQMRDGADLATLVRRGRGAAPGTVVLAMCGSGQAGSKDAVSPALQVARAGVALCIGFQGDQAAVRHVATFLRHLSAAISVRLSEDDHDRVGLIDWEIAIREARRRHPPGAVVPIVYAHPHLLTGRRIPATDRLITKLRSGKHATATAIPFYVPGQLACVQDDRRALRLPLAVDTGARVVVEVRAGRSSLTVDRRLAISSDDAELIARSWGIADEHEIEITIQPGPGDTREIVDWARHSAELSAFARALSKIFKADVPTTVQRLVEHAAAADWGARGAAPELLDVSTGESATRLTGQWPGLEVTAFKVGPIDAEDPLPLRDDLVTPAGSPDFELALATTEGVLALIGSQLDALRDSARERSTLSARIGYPVLNFTGDHLVAVPAAAVVRAGGPGGPAPLRAGVRRDNSRPADAPHDLD